MTYHKLEDLASLKNLNNRLLGIDLGTKTIGLALSDMYWIIASPFKTLERTKFHQNAKNLQKLIEDYAIVGIILGWPLNMNGSEGPRCQSTKQFAKNFSALSPLPIILWDERLSTMSATRTLIEANISRQKRAEVVDKMAASFILQSALDAFALKIRRSLEISP